MNRMFRPQSSTLNPRSSICLALATTILLALSCSDKQRTDISIGTGGTGGVYYPFGGGLADLWNRHVPGVRAVAEVTGASVENVRLAHKGETVIGEIMGDVAHQAYHGEGQFAGTPQNIVGLAVMYPSLLHIVALQGCAVDHLSQFAGHTVSIGAPGSGTAFMSDLILETLGINKDSFDVRRLSFMENTNALKDHSIDVGIWCVAPGSSSIMDLATTHHIKAIPFTPAEQARVTQRYSFYSAYDLPAGVYRGVDRSVPSLSVWNIIICQADLPEDLVYQLTKVLFENNDYLRNIHPYARYTTPENTVKHSPIPLHPGTIKYLKERSLDVPDQLVPPGRRLGLTH